MVTKKTPDVSRQDKVLDVLRGSGRKPPKRAGTQIDCYVYEEGTYTIQINRRVIAQGTGGMVRARNHVQSIVNNLRPPQSNNYTVTYYEV